MYQNNEPSALFHGLHHAHKRRVAEEQAARGIGDLGAPMLLLSLFAAEAAGEQWSQRDVARTLRVSPATVAVSLKTLDQRMLVGFSPEEKAQLTGFLTRMIDNLGGVEPPPFCPPEKEGEDRC